MNLTKPSLFSLFLFSLGILDAQIDLDFSPSSDTYVPTRIVGGDAGDKDDVFVFDDVGMQDGTSVDVTIEIRSIYGELRPGGSGAGAHEGVLGIANDSLVISLDGPSSNSNGNPYVEFRMSFWTSDGGTGTYDSGSAFTINSMRLQSYDIDSNAHSAGAGNRDFTDVFGYQTSSSPNVSLLSQDSRMEQTGFEADGNVGNGDDLTGYTFYRLLSDANQGNDPNGGVWDDSINVDFPTFGGDNELPSQYAYQMEFISLNTMDFVWGYTGPDSDTIGNRGMLLSGSTPPIIIPEPESLFLAGILIMSTGVMLLRRKIHN